MKTYYCALNPFVVHASSPKPQQRRTLLVEIIAVFQSPDNQRKWEKSVLATFDYIEMVKTQ